MTAILLYSRGWVQSTYPKTLSFAVAGDLHLLGRSRLHRPRELRSYFNQAETLARGVLEADLFYMNKDDRPVREEALTRMKLIARAMLGD